jgi:hypothetical protein
MDSAKLAADVTQALEAAGVSYLVLDQGEKYAGCWGQTVAQGSHWWVILG